MKKKRNNTVQKYKQMSKIRRISEPTGRVKWNLYFQQDGEKEATNLFSKPAQQMAVMSKCKAFSYISEALKKTFPNTSRSSLVSRQMT
jgi:hypothetical protein